MKIVIVIVIVAWELSKWIVNKIFNKYFND